MSGTAPPPAAERGATTVSDRAVSRIARRAAAEALPSGGTSTGATADVRRDRAAVGVRLALPHPVAVPEVAGRVQRHVAERATQLTGLTVNRVGVRVDRLDPGTRTPTTPDGGPQPGGEPAGARAAVRRRPWSPRGVTAAVTAAVGALFCAALLFLTVTAATGARPDARITRWTDALNGGLAGAGAADVAVLAAGGAVTAAGLWLLVLAFTPGARRRARMVAPAGDVRAVLDRRGIGLLLRDTAVDVPGVTAVRVRGRRRRSTVRATVAFGDPAEAHTALTRVLTTQIGHLALTRPPRLRVRVKPGQDWRPPEPATTEKETEAGS